MPLDSAWDTVFPSDLDHVAVKICGVTIVEEAQAIAAMGADAIGVNFWPRSKRYLPPEEAQSWLRELDGVLLRVAVTVNASNDELRRIWESGTVDWIQLHGDEGPDRVSSLMREGLAVFKALGVRDRTMLDGAVGYPSRTLLLDAYAPGLYGGSGETMDWALGAEAVRQWPDRQIILAGGLVPENVAAAVRQVRPAAVDVASGVETSPGRKDMGKVRDFIAAARVG